MPETEKAEKPDLEKELKKTKAALRGVEDERDEIRKTLRDREAKLSEHAVTMKRLERDLQLGSDSPLGWSGVEAREDIVSRVLAAFKSRGASDASLRVAHDKLMAQHAKLQGDFNTLHETYEKSAGAYASVTNVVRAYGGPVTGALPEIVSFLEDRLRSPVEKELVEATNGKEPSVEHRHVQVGAGEIHIHLHIV